METMVKAIGVRINTDDHNVIVDMEGDDRIYTYMPITKIQAVKMAWILLKSALLALIR